MARRRFLTGATAASVLGPAVAGAVPPALATLAWTPRTLCGLNMGYGSFWGRDVAPGQFNALSRYGCSFVRGMFYAYFLDGYQPGQVDAAVQPVSAVRPDGGDPSQLVLACAKLNYAPPAGDVCVLSAPIQYTGANGVTATLPAKTPLRIMGATVQRGEGHQPAANGEIRVQAGGTIADRGPQAVSGVELLHANFFREGSTPRRPISQYVRQASAWMAQGFGFIHAGWHDNWHDLFSRFGQDNVEPIREQEWAYFAGQNWSPKQALIADENEPVWPGADFAARWRAYRPYFQDVIHPRMRHHFPAHTLGFGNPYWCSLDSALAVDWWPDDRNTVMRVHFYPGKGGAGTGKVDAQTTPPIEAYLHQLAALQKGLRIPQICVEEFGLPVGYPNRSAALRNIRRAVEAHGWPCAVWSASTAQPEAGNEAAALDGAGLWRPVDDALGAFGTD